MKERTVLLVEDDPVARFVTQRQLSKLGYACRAVVSGEEALRSIDRISM